MQRFHVYAIFSEKLNTIYIGQTSDLEKRLAEHCKGYSLYTSRTNDWELFYHEEFSNRSETLRREKQLKSSRGRAYLWDRLKKRKPQVKGQSID